MHKNLVFVVSLLNLAGTAAFAAPYRAPAKATVASKPVAASKPAVVASKAIATTKTIVASKPVAVAKATSASKIKSPPSFQEWSKTQPKINPYSGNSQIRSTLYSMQEQKYMKQVWEPFTQSLGLDVNGRKLPQEPKRAYDFTNEQVIKGQVPIGIQAQIKTDRGIIGVDTSSYVSKQCSINGQCSGSKADQAYAQSRQCTPVANWYNGCAQKGNIVEQAFKKYGYN